METSEDQTAEKNGPPKKSHSAMKKLDENVSKLTDDDYIVAIFATSSAMPP